MQQWYDTISICCATTSAPAELSLSLPASQLFLRCLRSAASYTVAWRPPGPGWQLGKVWAKKSAWASEWSHPQRIVYHSR